MIHHHSLVDRLKMPAEDWDGSKASCRKSNDFLVVVASGNRSVKLWSSRSLYLSPYRREIYLLGKGSVSAKEQQVRH